MTYTNITKLRKEMSISQQELAKLTGVSQSQLSKIEKGTINSPAHDKLIRIAEALGRNVDDLMDGHPEDVTTSFKAFNHAHQGAVVFIPLHNEYQEMNTEFSQGEGFVIRAGGGSVQTKKPSFLDYSSEAYAAVNYGAAMLPRYRSGDTLFIDPQLTAKVGDDVALMFELSDRLCGIFREVVKIGTDDIHVKDVQNNKTVSFKLADLFGAHVVVGSQRSRM